MRTKKIIASVLLFASVFSFVSVPVHAVTDYQSSSNFWQWVADGTGGLPQKLLGYVTGDAVCPDSEDGKHHASSVVFDKGNGHYACTCAYCGESYTATQTDISNAYTDTVNDMQFKSIDSDGGVFWAPTVNDISGSLTVTFCDGVYSVPYENGNLIISVGGSIEASFFSSSTFRANLSAANSPSVVVPLSAVYTIVEPSCCSIRGVSSSGTIENKVKFGSTSTCAAIAGGTIGCGFASAGLSSLVVQCDASLSFPVFKITNIHSSDLDDTYSPSFRATSITGDYSVVGDNNEVTVFDETIFNEDNSTFYNPITGDTTTVENWTYDYSTRTYNFSGGDGGESSLTYGDDNIVLTDSNGNSFNIFYGDVRSTGGDNGGDSGGGSSSGSGGGLEFVNMLKRFFDRLMEGIIRLINSIADWFDFKSTPNTDSDTDTPAGATSVEVHDNVVNIYNGGEVNDVNYTDDSDPEGDSEEDPDSPDGRAHSHDDDDPSGWFLWFIRRLVRLGSRSVRGLARVIAEDALDGVEDNLDSVKQFYLYEEPEDEGGFSLIMDGTDGRWTVDDQAAEVWDRW